MTQVVREQGESIERLMKRFKKALQEDKVLSTYRRNTFYEKPSQARKRDAAAKLRKSRQTTRKNMAE